MNTDDRATGRVRLRCSGLFFGSGSFAILTAAKIPPTTRVIIVHTLIIVSPEPHAKVLYTEMIMQLKFTVMCMSMDGIIELCFTVMLPRSTDIKKAGITAGRLHVASAHSRADIIIPKRCEALERFLSTTPRKISPSVTGTTTHENRAVIAAVSQFFSRCMAEGIYPPHADGTEKDIRFESPAKNIPVMKQITISPVLIARQLFTSRVGERSVKRHPAKNTAIVEIMTAIVRKAYHSHRR